MCPFFVYALGVFSFDFDKRINMDYGSGMKFYLLTISQPAVEKACAVIVLPWQKTGTEL